MAKTKSSSKIKSREKILDYILVVVFIGILIITLYPFLNVLAISLNDPIDTMRNINFIIPRKFTWNNYVSVFRDNNLIQPFMLSVLRTVVGTVISLVSTSMIAPLPLTMDADTKCAALMYQGLTTGYGVGISADCEDPVAAIKFIDYICSDEGQVLTRWGIEGVNYEIDEEGHRYRTQEEIDYSNTDKDYT